MANVGYTEGPSPVDPHVQYLATPGAVGSHSGGSGDGILRMVAMAVAAGKIVSVFGVRDVKNAYEELT